MSGLRDVFTAGQCNVDGVGGQSMNPATNFLNQLVMGKQQQMVAMPGLRHVDPSQQQIADTMAMFNTSWADSKAHTMNMDAMAHAKMAQMQGAFMEARMVEEEMMRRQLIMDEQWKAQVEAQMAMDWKGDFIQNELLQSKAAMMDGAFQEAQRQIEQQDTSGQSETIGMIGMMESDPDPRFKQSKFLQFLKKVNTGEYELTTDNKLVVHPEKAQLEVTQVDKD